MSSPTTAQPVPAAAPAVVSVDPATTFTGAIVDTTAGATAQTGAEATVQTGAGAAIQTGAGAEAGTGADKLAELQGADRHLRTAPAVLKSLEAAVAASVAAAGASATKASVAIVPATDSARPATQRPASRSATRKSATRASTARGATAQRRPAQSRPRTSAPPNRPRTRNRTGTGAPAALQSGAGDSSVVGFALAQVGKEYSFGSVGPDEFDCSGLVVAAYRRIGISLPHSTGGLAYQGRPVGRNELRPGDLVFPSTGHVGIYIGDGRIVHASTVRSGVKVSSIYAFRYARRVTG